VLLKEKSVSDKMLLSSSMIKSNQIRTCFRDLYFIKPNLMSLIYSIVPEDPI
jgi:hypothetical protein